MGCCKQCEYRQRYLDEEFNKKLNELFKEYDIKVSSITWDEVYGCSRAITIDYSSDVSIKPKLYNMI
jgi:hypothetical protein